MSAPHPTIQARIDANRAREQESARWLAGLAARIRARTARIEAATRRHGPLGYQEGVGDA